MWNTMTTDSWTMGMLSDHLVGCVSEYVWGGSGDPTRVPVIFSTNLPTSSCKINKLMMVMIFPTNQSNSRPNRRHTGDDNVGEYFFDCMKRHKNKTK